MRENVNKLILVSLWSMFAMHTLALYDVDAESKLFSLFISDHRSLHMIYFVENVIAIAVTAVLAVIYLVEWIIGWVLSWKI